MVILYQEINYEVKHLHLMLHLMKNLLMKNYTYKQENIQLIMYFKDIIVQCLPMDKQVLVKHIQFKEIEIQILVCVIEPYKIFLIEYN